MPVTGPTKQNATFLVDKIIDRLYDSILDLQHKEFGKYKVFHEVERILQGYFEKPENWYDFNRHKYYVIGLLDGLLKEKGIPYFVQSTGYTGEKTVLDEISFSKEELRERLIDGFFFFDCEDF